MEEGGASILKREASLGMREFTADRNRGKKVGKKGEERRHCSQHRLETTECPVWKQGTYMLMTVVPCVLMIKAVSCSVRNAHTCGTLTHRH